MNERILDNALMVLTMALMLTAFAVSVAGAIGLFVHGFSWLTLTWTLGAYVCLGLLCSVMGRDYNTALTWAEEG